MNISLKKKILAWFVFYSLFLLLIITSLNSHYYRKREEKNQLIERFARVETMLMSIFKNSNAFFSSEITNPAFFQSGESVYLRKNDSLTKIVLNELKVLRDLSSDQKININEETDSILVYLTEFNLIFKQIVNLMHQKGYKDWGIEGEMRTEIHKLEQIQKIDQTNVLSLRRHEKQYILKLYGLTEEFKLNIAQNDLIDKKQKDSVIQILDKYKLLFSIIVNLDQQLGVHDNSALKGQLGDLSYLLERHVEKLIKKADRERQQLLNNSRINYVIEIIITILLSSVISLLITKKVTGSLVMLTQYISNLRKDDPAYAQVGFIEFGYRLEADGIHLFVKDTGIGIPMLKQEIVFERFRQSDESRTRKYGGTGLGLSIVKNLVELLGGTIYLQSEEGRGSEFSFTLPLNEIDTEQETIIRMDEKYYARTTPNWENKTILIVEDDFASRQLLDHILKPTGVKIIPATNGIEAVENFLKNEHINIILMDIQMPFENGFEATKKIRKLNREIPNYCTNCICNGRRKEYVYPCRMHGLCYKTNKRELLLNKINEYLNNHKTK